MTNVTRLVAALIASLAIGMAAPAAQTLKGHGPRPGSGSYIATVAIGQMAEKHAGISIQLQAGQTGTRSVVALARGQIDFTLLPVPAVAFLREGAAMYRNMDNATELYGNLRGMLVWECCMWHFIAYDNSGIATMDDFAGKRVYTGPPGSVAKRILEGIIAAATGLTAGQDYTPINLDWGAGAQALRDGNVDVLIEASPIGSANVEQLSVSRDIRLIGLPPVDGNEALTKATDNPGNMLSEIPPGVYTGQANEEPVRVVALRHIAGVGVHVDEEIVYRMTKAIWENIEEFYGYGQFLRKVNPDLAFRDMNVPLHVGAYRYYREAGWQIPDALVPPEAR